MGPQDQLTVATDAAAPGPVEAGVPGERPVPWSAYLGVATIGVAVGVWATRSFFLFNDDYLFLGQADRTTFGFDYLAEGLFQHFSPVSRLLDAAAIVVLPHHPWAARVILLTLFTVYVAAVHLLTIVFLGRTRVGLVAAVSLSTSLAVLPLTNWWTAGLNILPALAGCAACLAGAVALARGGSAWGGVLSVAGYLLGVLDYETAMLVPAYALGWVLLFPGDDGRVSLRTLWRRTGWLWVALGVVGAASLANYRLNYYVDTPGASLGAYAGALVKSLFEVQLPLVLGFSDLDNRAFTWCGIVLAIFVVAALMVRALRRPAMWKGLAFALAGWLLPLSALVLNRVGVVGEVVVTLPYYYALSTVLVVLGLGAALSVRAPADEPGARRAARPSRSREALPLLLVAVVVLAWAHSLGPTSRIVFVAGHRLFPEEPVNTQSFVTALRSSGRDVARSDPSATLLDGVVPDSVVWSQYAPYNRLNVVAPLIGVGLPIDNPDGSPYVATDGGRLARADLDWRQRLTVHDGHEAGLTVGGVSSTEASGAGACFETADGTAVEWLLPAPVQGDHLLVRAEVVVDRATPYTMYTAAGSADYGFANNSGKAWDRSGDTWLDTVDAHRVDKLVITGLDPGVRVCLASLSIGEAVPR